ncbi:MAG: DMT family transporter [Planctomycetaceae bacterium]
MAPHLLFPLFSSVVFVLAMLFVKQGIQRGASPWTGTFYGNLWLALIWAAIAVARNELVPSAAWTDAAIIGLLFFLGQLFTYLAFKYGDVSVATPIFGVKVLMVAVLTSIQSGTRVAGIIWLAGALATVGIMLIQSSGGHLEITPRRRNITILLAMTAAFCLSLFDVCLQSWAAAWTSYAFLPVMFGCAAVLSLTFLPAVDSISRLHELKATWWMLAGTVLMALQAMSMCFSLAEFQDAPRINIVYALRGLWGVVLAWMLSRVLKTSESRLARIVMLKRLLGAGLLTAAVVIAIQKQ